MEKFNFRPRARLLQILGDQLIRDPRIGVFELVKNAYDADSPSADVVFKNIASNKAYIQVKDFGEGMDIETIRNVWLEPGADHRQIQRERGDRTPIFHRLPIGEKGVGRFAAHKLGNKIRMVTRKKGKPEVVLTIDWNLLTSTNRYLSDALVNVTSREPIVFKGDNEGSTGTLIKIEELRHKWTRGDIRRLYRSVNAITSPFDDKYGFSVNFELDPDPNWLGGLLDAKDIKEQAMFYFKFSIEKNKLNFKYSFRPLPGLESKGIKSREVEKKDQVLEFIVYEKNDAGKKVKRTIEPDLSCFGIGPIAGEIHGFDRDKKILNLYVSDQTGLEEYLDTQGGVRVYRDGIRVYDYGEPENDWLGLDERRVQFPARRISNNLVLGEVHLQLEKSKDLIEKTNREGFVENSAYTIFREAVIGAVVRFEIERSIDKDLIRDAFEKDSGPLGKISGPEEAIAALREKVREAGQEKTLGEYVNKVEATFKEMRDNLLDAVGSGLGLSTVFHEIERGVRDLYQSISQKDPIDRLQILAKNLIELLQGASYFVRTASKQKHRASDIVKHAIFSNSLRFGYHNIQLKNCFEDNPELDFEIRGSRRMITASVVNLIDNAIYWLNLYRRDSEPEKNKIPKRIWIGPSLELGGSAIVVADNGPGIEDDPSMLIRPFFSRKQEGMGMGLYFVNLTMQAHGGRLDFPRPGEVDIPKAYSGAVLALVFKRGIQ